MSVRLAVRNLLATGPLFVVEVLGATLLALLDPPLLMIGLPLALLCVMRLTARFGLHGRGSAVSAGSGPLARGAISRLVRDRRQFRPRTARTRSVPKD